MKYGAGVFQTSATVMQDALMGKNGQQGLAKLSLEKIHACYESAKATITKVWDKRKEAFPAIQNAVSALVTSIKEGAKNIVRAVAGRTQQKLI